MTTTTDLKALLAEYIGENERGTNLIIADVLADMGKDKLAAAFRRGAAPDDITEALLLVPLRVGRQSLKGWLVAQTKDAVDSLYAARRDRAEHPEGEFDKRGRWYPSSAEDCGDVGGYVRSPSANWPYSYMLRCRTKSHCRRLIFAGIYGFNVPVTVTRRTTPIRAALLALLTS